MESVKRDNIITLISLRYAMLTKIAAWLIILCFSVTNLTYGADRSDIQNYGNLRAVREIETRCPILETALNGLRVRIATTDYAERLLEASSALAITLPSFDARPCRFLVSEETASDPKALQEVLKDGSAVPLREALRRLASASVIRETTPATGATPEEDADAKLRAGIQRFLNKGRYREAIRLCEDAIRACENDDAKGAEWVRLLAMAQKAEKAKEERTAVKARRKVKTQEPKPVATSSLDDVEAARKAKQETVFADLKALHIATRRHRETLDLLDPRAVHRKVIGWAEYQSRSEAGREILRSRHGAIIGLFRRHFSGYMATDALASHLKRLTSEKGSATIAAALAGSATAAFIMWPALTTIFVLAIALAVALSIVWNKLRKPSIRDRELEDKEKEAIKVLYPMAKDDELHRIARRIAERDDEAFIEILSEGVRFLRSKGYKNAQKQEYYENLIVALLGLYLSVSETAKILRKTIKKQRKELERYVERRLYECARSCMKTIARQKLGTPELSYNGVVDGLVVSLVKSTVIEDHPFMKQPLLALIYQKKVIEDAEDALRREIKKAKEKRREGPKKRKRPKPKAGKERRRSRSARPSFSSKKAKRGLTFLEETVLIVIVFLLVIIAADGNVSMVSPCGILILSAACALFTWRFVKWVKLRAPPAGLREDAFPPPTKVKSVFFDVGNVILYWDCRPFAEAMHRYCRDKAKWTVESIIQYTREEELLKLLETGRIEPTEYFQIVKKTLGLLNITEEEFFKYYNDIFTLNSDVLKAMNKLKAAGYKIYIISNTSKPHKEFFTERFSEAFGLVDPEGAVFSYEAGIMKTRDNPAIFRIALERTGVKPEEAVFLDDVADYTRLASSPAVGMHAIHCPVGSNVFDSLREFLIKSNGPLRGPSLLRRIARGAGYLLLALVSPLAMVETPDVREREERDGLTHRYGAVCHNPWDFRPLDGSFVTASFDIDAKVEQGHYPLTPDAEAMSNLIKVRINDEEYFIGKGHFIKITLNDGDAIYWGSRHNHSYSFWFDYFGERALDVIHGGGKSFIHIDAHHDATDSDLVPLPPIAEGFERQIVHGYRELEPHNYVLQAVNAGIIPGQFIQFVYGLSTDPLPIAFRTVSDRDHFRFPIENVCRFLMKTEFGDFIVDTDADVLVGDEEDMPYQQVLERGELMLPYLLAITCRSPLNTIATSGFEYQNSRGEKKTAYINPRAATVVAARLVHNIVTVKNVASQYPLDAPGATSATLTLLKSDDASLRFAALDLLVSKRPFIARDADPAFSNRVFQAVRELLDDEPNDLVRAMACDAYVAYYDDTQGPEDTTPPTGATPEEITEEERDVVTHIFRAIGIPEELRWDEAESGFAIARLPLADLNSYSILTAFELQETTDLRGTLSIIRYGNIPIFLCLQNAGDETRIIDLSSYYSIDEDRRRHIRAEIERVFLPGVSEDSYREIYPAYVYSDLSTADMAIDTYTGHSEEREKIPVLPGVFYALHPSTTISARATAVTMRFLIKRLKERKEKSKIRVLVMGSGVGLEARIAAKIAAEEGVEIEVNAADYKDMAVESTRLTASRAGVEEKVHAFKSDLFSSIDDGEKYDLIVFAMPYPTWGWQNYDESESTPIDRNVRDYGGRLLLNVAANISRYMADESCAVIVNQDFGLIEQLLKAQTGLEVVTDYFMAEGSSQAFIVIKGDGSFKAALKDAIEEARTARIRSYPPELISNGKEPEDTTPATGATPEEGEDESDGLWDLNLGWLEEDRAIPRSLIRGNAINVFELERLINDAIPESVGELTIFGSLKYMADADGYTTISEAGKRKIDDIDGLCSEGRRNFFHSKTFTDLVNKRLAARGLSRHLSFYSDVQNGVTFLRVNMRNGTTCQLLVNVEDAPEPASIIFLLLSGTVGYIRRLYSELSVDRAPQRLQDFIGFHLALGYYLGRPSRFEEFRAEWSRIRDVEEDDSPLYLELARKIANDREFRALTGRLKEGNASLNGPEIDLMRARIAEDKKRFKDTTPATGATPEERPKVAAQGGLQVAKTDAGLEITLPDGTEIAAASGLDLRIKLNEYSFRNNLPFKARQLDAHSRIEFDVRGKHGHIGGFHFKDSPQAILDTLAKLFEAVKEQQAIEQPDTSAAAASEQGNLKKASSAIRRNPFLTFMSRGMLIWPIVALVALGLSPFIVNKILLAIGISFFTAVTLYPFDKSITFHKFKKEEDWLVRVTRYVAYHLYCQLNSITMWGCLVIAGNPVLATLIHQTVVNAVIWYPVCRFIFKDLSKVVQAIVGMAPGEPSPNSYPEGPTGALGEENLKVLFIRILDELSQKVWLQAVEFDAYRAYQELDREFVKDDTFPSDALMLWLDLACHRLERKTGISGMRIVAPVKIYFTRDPKRLGIKCAVKAGPDERELFSFSFIYLKDSDNRIVEAMVIDKEGVTTARRDLLGRLRFSDKPRQSNNSESEDTTPATGATPEGEETKEANGDVVAAERREDGRVWLNVGIIDGIIREIAQRVEAGAKKKSPETVFRATVVKSARYLADNQGWVPLDLINDLDMQFYYHEATGIDLKAMMHEFEAAFAARIASLAGIHLNDEFQFSPWEMRIGGYLRRIHYWSGTNWHIRDPELGGPLDKIVLASHYSTAPKQVDRCRMVIQAYLDAEYYLGDDKKYHCYKDRYLSIAMSDDKGIRELAKEIIEGGHFKRLGDLFHSIPVEPCLAARNNHPIGIGELKNTTPATGATPEEETGPITLDEIKRAMVEINEVAPEVFRSEGIRHRLALKILNMRLKRGKSFLVVGPSIASYFPEVLAKIGLKVTVIDTDEEVASFLPQHYRSFGTEEIEVFGSYEDLRERRFDYISALGVLHEYDHPREVAEFIEPILNCLNLEGGYLFVTELTLAQKVAGAPFASLRSPLDLVRLYYLKGILRGLERRFGARFVLQDHIDIDDLDLRPGEPEPRTGLVYRAEPQDTTPATGATPEEEVSAEECAMDDTEAAVNLAINLLEGLVESRTYRVTYDRGRIPQELAERYIDIVRSVAGDANIRVHTFDSSNRRFKKRKDDPVISVICEKADRREIGEGHIMIPAKERVEGSFLRVVAMMNLAFASANVPDNLSQENIDKYRGLIAFIQAQYAAIFNGKKTLDLSDNSTPEDILKTIRRIILEGMPEAEPEEIDDYRNLTLAMLTAV